MATQFRELMAALASYAYRSASGNTLAGEPNTSQTSYMPDATMERPAEKELSHQQRRERGIRPFVGNSHVNKREEEMNRLVKNTPLGHIWSLLLWALVLAPTVGCTGNVERKWSEEVALDDGSVIVIDRYIKFQESNSLAGDAYNTTSIKGTLAFTGKQAELPKWDVPLTPIVLYRDAKLDEWVVVATTSNCDTWYERGKPEPPYWEFRLRAGKWTTSQLSNTSIGRKANLFFNYEPALPAKKIGVELKAQILANNDFASKYRSVVADLKSRCGY